MAYREGYHVIAPGTNGRRTRKKDLNLGLQEDFSLRVGYRPVVFLAS